MGTAMVVDLAAAVTVISPHLDDAVFSCGGLIAAARAARVVTVFAGVPPADMPAPDWDQAAGFASAEQAVLSRRREDNHALTMLGAHAVWLDFWDSQYGRRYTAPQLADALRTVLLTQTEGVVVAPLGLFHSDHALVHDACRLLMLAAHAHGPAWSAPPAAAPTAAPTVAPPPVQWLFYEDAIYRRMPGLLQQRLVQCRDSGLLATPVNLPVAQYLTQKSYALNAYQSQLQLFSEDRLCDLCAPERYWMLQPAGAGPA
ncbi:PIG-L family deacetylase [Cupriavidus alkaliphilus]|uniref:LmbE family N-acetylglucosaminyl deacetylase n=1 Tax=Cupriavidus alkaliphilus TaxID=942866 RepID=A0A7W4VBM7_9BURK|nr:PIG-L family deacetylase [Cupriavidus alkaliphilus]MBB3008660.1 LmbE family N-acetylglucosaminyl deacetylase [Cupriavidus alkaliphilus]